MKAQCCCVCGPAKCVAHPVPVDSTPTLAPTPAAKLGERRSWSLCHMAGLGASGNPLHTLCHRAAQATVASAPSAPSCLPACHLGAPSQCKQLSTRVPPGPGRSTAARHFFSSARGARCCVPLPTRRHSLRRAAVAAPAAACLLRLDQAIFPLTALLAPAGSWLRRAQAVIQDGCRKRGRVRPRP